SRGARAGAPRRRAERPGGIRARARQRLALRARREGPAPPASDAGGDVRRARRHALALCRRAARAGRRAGRRARSRRPRHAAPVREPRRRGPARLRVRLSTRERARRAAGPRALVTAFEAGSLDPVGPDSDDDANLAVLPERVAVGVEIFLGELVDVGVGTFVRELGLAGGDERVLAVPGI